VLNGLVSQIGNARAAAGHATEIETELPGLDNTDAVLSTAAAAGEALASAGMATGEVERAIAGAAQTVDRLR
jgi:hypothetical protein